nr:CcsA [Erythrocladia irregularis]
MPNFQNSLVNYTFLDLLISMFMYWTSIAFPQFSIMRLIGQTGVIIANISIALILSCRWWNEGYFPLSNLYESLLFLSWALTTVQLILEYRIKNQIIGAVTTPVSMFIIAFASISLPNEMQKAAPLVPALKSNWLMMHVSIMIISYATLILGSLLSILFLIITKGREVNLKGSSLGSKVQPEKMTEIQSINQDATINLNDVYKQVNLLESIDNLSYRTIGLGFPLLTIGIIAGAVWANEAWGTYWSWDPKETWALITWLIFAAYLHTRINKAWKGKKPAILASVGFVVVWVCYLGVNFLGKGLHSYGWVS